MDQRLETFLTVCATMNYRKAAEQLHLPKAQKNGAGRNA